MRFGKITLMAAALAVALTACGRGDEEFTDATPNMDGLALEISNQVAEGVTVQGLEGQSSQGVATVPEYLQAARTAVRELNAMLRRELEPVVSLIAQRGTIEPGQARVYGPKDQDGATWRLGIKRIEVNKYAWRLDAKPIGADDTAYLIIMGGGMARGVEAHRGRGVVGVNLDNLKLVLGDAFAGQGKMLAAFAHVENAAGTLEAKSLAYLLHGFTPDATQHDPVDAAFVGHKLLPSGATGIRLLAKVNIGATATTAKETVALRVRWIPGTGGAGAIRAWGGDIPEGTWYRGFACWDAQEMEGFKALASCTLNATTGLPECSPVQGYPVGQLSNCRPGTGEADVVPPEMSDVVSTTPEAGAPSTDPLTVPSDVPSGDGF
ncbi:MAG TPA: hypothetical protein VND93_16360 [Myxococcales bacterium]|nr:hypothetical protein [Myxococcales bacterium]